MEVQLCSTAGGATGGWTGTEDSPDPKYCRIWFNVLAMGAVARCSRGTEMAVRRQRRKRFPTLRWAAKT